MTRSIIKTSKAPAPVGPYSQAVSCGNILFVSGQIPLDPISGELVGNSFAEQCHRVLLNLKIILEEDLLENIKTFYSSVSKSKPDAVKGSFIKKVTIASTMGVGLNINQASLR